VTQLGTAGSRAGVDVPAGLLRPEEDGGDGDEESDRDPEPSD
jgi:hypothetical protein